MNDLAKELRREVCTLIGALCVDKMELQLALAAARAELDKRANESRPRSEDSAADPAPRAEA